MKPINTMRVKDCDQLSSILVRLADNGYITSCMMTFDRATELLKALSTYDDVKISDVELYDPRYNDYDCEYYITLETNLEVTVEPSFHSGDHDEDSWYLFNFADIYFFDGEVNSSALELYQECECYELDFIDEGEMEISYGTDVCVDVIGDDCDDGCCDCCEDCSDCDEFDPCEHLIDCFYNIKCILDDIFE